jgi:hypothetical protein
MTAAGVATRTAISPSDPSWDWAVSAAAPFDIDNQSLAAFLRWAARESGRPLVYASPEVQALAESIRLRGSIAGLDLNTALAVTLSTTQLRRVAANDAAIAIAREGEVDSTLPSRLTP